MKSEQGASYNFNARVNEALMQAVEKVESIPTIPSTSGAINRIKLSIEKGRLCWKSSTS